MQTYEEVSQAYRRIFDRVGVKYVTVRDRVMIMPLQCLSITSQYQRRLVL
jgi:hypothetical protein